MMSRVAVRKQEQVWLKDIGIAFVASIVIALAGGFTIPLPFTPIPLALQCHVALLVAAILGPKRGFLAILFFLAEGAMGYPVFAGGAFGIAHLLGPRGGYLLGYLCAGFYVGLLQEKNTERSRALLFRNMLFGNLIVYLFGWAYLSTFIGMEKALILGVAPFLIGDTLKLLFFTRCGELFYQRVTRP